MAKLSQKLEIISELWALLGGAILISIMLITNINVLSVLLDRVLSPFGVHVSGLSGYEDFVQLAISCSVMMFFPYCQYRHGHISVDILMGKLPIKIVNFLDYVWRLVVSLLALFLAYWMFYGMLENYTDQALSPILGWARWPFYIPGIISLALWAIVAILQDKAEDLTAVDNEL